MMIRMKGKKTDNSPPDFYLPVVEDDMIRIDENLRYHRVYCVSNDIDVVENKGLLYIDTFSNNYQEQFNITAYVIKNRPKKLILYFMIKAM